MVTEKIVKRETKALAVFGEAHRQLLQLGSEIRTSMTEHDAEITRMQENIAYLQAQNAELSKEHARVTGKALKIEQLFSDIG